MEDNRSLRLGNFSIPLVRCKLREWLRLEDIRIAILDAVRDKEKAKLASSIYAYISVASSISIDDLHEFPWWELADAYREFLDINVPKIILPFIRPVEKGKSPILREKVGWDYPGHAFYLWANLIAKTYGWTLEYISNLDLDDGLSLIQEILVEEQLHKEWEWGLSENAFSYDINTKQSKFNPLKRPEWMKPAMATKEIPKSRMKIEDIPAGIVLRWDDGKSSRPQ